MTEAYIMANSIANRIIPNFDNLKIPKQRYLLKREIIDTINHDVHREKLVYIKNVLLNNLDDYIYNSQELMNYNHLFNRYFCKADIFKIVDFCIENDFFTGNTFILSISILNMLSEEILTYLLLKGFELPKEKIIIRKEFYEDNKK